MKIFQLFQKTNSYALNIIVGLIRYISLYLSSKIKIILFALSLVVAQIEGYYEIIPIV